MIDDSTPIIQWLNEQPKVTTINDLPKEHAPNIDVDHPTVYAFLLASINPWPIPPSFKKRLQSVEHDGMQVLNITCSMSMTFYHSKTKRFFGSTYLGHEHHCTIQRSSSKIVFENFNELTYFFTRINDPNCFIVIELVMNILSPLSGGLSGRVGCGWAILNPYVGELKSTGKFCLYEGSPKRLLECKGNHTAIQNHLAKHNKATSVLAFTIWRCESLSKTLPDCLKENQIVGAHTPIAGLRCATINYFDDRQSVVENCIGASTHGNILDWTLSPPQLFDTNIFANFRTIKASNISVTLPLRRELERALESWMKHSLPKEDRTSSIFPWRKAKVLEDNGTASVIMQPRIRMAVHNGHTILRGQSYEMELHSSVDDEDRLYAKSEIEMDYFEHNSCSLLCKVEYCITNITTTKGLQSPSKSISHQITVVVGMSLYFPSILDKRCGVMLNLVDDARCQILCNDHLFSRQRCSESDSPQSLLKFELAACDILDDSCLDNSTASTLLHITDDIKDDDRVDSEHDGLSVLRIDDGESLSKATSPCNEDVSLSDSTSSHRIEVEERSVIKEQITTDDGLNSESEIEAKSDTQAALPIEVADPNQLTSVTITFRTLSTESSFKVSKPLSFQLKFHAYDEIITTHAIRFVNGVIKFTHPDSFSFVYDYSTVDSKEELVLYMMGRNLYIEVFDDSLTHLGTITLPMHIFLRQGKERKILENLSVDIIASVYDNDTLRLDEPNVGRVAGSVILSIDCVGSITPAGPLFSPTASTGAESKRVIARQYGWERGVKLVKDDIKNKQVSDKSLKAIQCARESEKHAIIANHVLHQKATTYTFRPWVGAKVIRVYSFTKRLPTNEKYDIEISHPGVQVLNETEGVPHCEGSTSEAAIRDIELAFDCNYIEPITVTVSLVSFLTRQVVDAIKIEIRPKLRVDRRFVLPCITNEYIRKTIIADSTGDGLKASIKVIDSISCSNRITVNERIGVSKTSKVDIELLCLERNKTRFYILFSYDDFVTLHETWEFIVVVQSAPTLKKIGGWKGVFDFSDTVDEC
jgi:hypothetical protein